MSGFDLTEADQWRLGPLFGLDHWFFRVNKPTILYTWITLVIIALFLFLGRYFLRKKKGLGNYITLSFIQFFVGLINQALETF